MLSKVSKIGRWVSICIVLSVFMGACSWFKPRPEFEGVEISKPLVIPADLNKPTSNEALVIPSKSLIGTNAKTTEVVSQFVVSDSVENVWKRLGAILPTIEGVKVINAVGSIKSYEVQYGADVFLITAQANGNQTQVTALGADGAVTTNKSSGQLLAQLKLLIK